MARMQGKSECMSLKWLMGCGAGERIVLRSGEEAVYGRYCEEWEQNYGLFLALVSRGAVVLPRSEAYDSLSAKMAQRLRDVLEAGPVFLDPEHVTLVCMRPVGVSCSRVGVCVAGFSPVFGMYKVGLDSWKQGVSDEEWLELVGQLLLVIRLRLVTQTACDQQCQVMDCTRNFQSLKFDPSEQTTTTRVKPSGRKLTATPETATGSMEDLLSFLRSPEVTVLTVNQSNRPRKETGELTYRVDSIFLQVAEESAISETIKALNLDLYTHKVRVGIVSFQCLCLSLPPRGEVNRESVYQALVASRHPAVAFFHGDSAQPVWAVAGHGAQGSLRPGKVCGVGEICVKFASEALAETAQQSSAAVALLEKAETEFTSVRPSLIRDEHRQLSFVQQIRVAEMIQRGVFATDITLKSFFSVAAMNNKSKPVSLLVRQGEDEVAVSVFRTRTETIRCAKTDKFGLPANVAIDYLARLQLLRVLQVAVRGKTETNSYRPMLAVDIPWVTAARSQTISEEHKRHGFASFSQSFPPAAQDVRPLSPTVLSQVAHGEAVFQHMFGFLSQTSLLAYSSLEATLVVHHWNHRAVCIIARFCHVAFATLKHDNVEIPAYALKFTDSTAAPIMDFVRTLRASPLPEAERIDAVNWALTRPSVAVSDSQPEVSLQVALPANAILSTLSGSESPDQATVSAVKVMSPTSRSPLKTEEGGVSTDEDARRLSSSSGSLPDGIDKAIPTQVNKLGEAGVSQAPSIDHSGKSPSQLKLTCIPAVELDTGALPVSQPAEPRQLSLTVDAILGTPRGADSSSRSPSISPATVSVLMPPSSPSSLKTAEGGLRTDQDARRPSSSSGSVIDKAARLQVHLTSCSGDCRATLPEDSCKNPLVLQLTCTSAVERDTVAHPGTAAVSQTSASLQAPLVTNVVLKNPLQNENPGHSPIIRPATVSAVILMSPSSGASFKTEEGGTRMDEETRRRRSSSSAPRVIDKAPSLTGYSRVRQPTQTEHSCKSPALLPLTEPGITCPQSVGTKGKKGKWQALVSWIKRAVACT